MTDQIIFGYDAWNLAILDDERDGIGTEEGQPCNRIEEPDEDAPRGYRPKPCKGVMEMDSDGLIACDTCGEMT